MLTARLSAISLLVLAHAALGCSADAESPATGEGSDAVTTSQLPDDAQSLWKQYVAKTTKGASLQPGCEPMRVSPPSSVPYRGVIILFHGFTACPQQFHELSSTLAGAGFEVLLPLLPGHGRVPQRNGSAFIDDISDLPTGYTKGRYADLGKEMNSIARASTGTRIVGGLSLGGAVATSAMIDAPGLYARGLLLSPLFQIPGAQGTALKAANILTPTKRSGWGEGCLVQRTAPRPRAGICEYQFNQLRGAAEFAESVAANASRVTIPVQVAGVEADSAADDTAMQNVSKAMRSSNICFFAKGVPHSLLSRFDSPGKDMFWLPSALHHISGFLVEGSPFATAGASTEAPALQCKI